MRILTCTPVEFEGNAGFFERDSGLLCRGLQALGVESRAVMPGRRRDDDESDLIRTEYGNLESAAWWRSHGLDGVVLYAWGAPRFRRVAQAIRDAGVFLVLNQDNGGLVSPLAGPAEWLAEQRNHAGRGTGVAGWMRFVRLVARGVTVGLGATDPLRAQHLKCGNVIACVSPKAAEYYRRLCRIYGGAELAERVVVLPHGVGLGFRWSGGAKRRQVVCVGRWQDTVQKRPRLLAEVLGRLLEADDEVTVAVAGQPDESLLAWHAGLDDARRGRVRITGRVDRRELRVLMDESQVFYSPSAFESFGIAAAEALCCGCSVVAAKSVSMVSFEWFTGEASPQTQDCKTQDARLRKLDLTTSNSRFQESCKGSGQLASSDTAGGHAEALRAELGKWAEGHRNPAEISAAWCERLHADKLAAKVVEMVGRKAESGKQRSEVSLSAGRAGRPRAADFRSA